MTPRVSIITVCYNAAAQLLPTLQSSVAQDYPNKEIVIVDGGSTDGTADIIQQHKHHIDRWVSEPDGGIYDAMNKGVRMATGDWVIFMNAGDLFAATDVLSRIFQSDRSRAGVLYGDVVKDGTVKVATAQYRVYHRMLFCHQSSLVRRELLLRTPFDTSHRMSADFKSFLMLHQQGVRFEHVGFAIAVFDTSGVSNVRRSAGLKDNLSVLAETVPLAKRWRHTLSLWLTYIVCRLRGK